LAARCVRKMQKENEKGGPTGARLFRMRYV
jgi:hypothetical protein